MKKFTLIFIMLLAIAGISRAQVIEDFESIPLNRLSGGEVTDSSSFAIVANPDASGINTSPYVLKFLRDKDAVAWSGFWSKVPDSVDVTVNKYVHIKLWKPRISETRFKLEGGAAGTLEIPSMSAQTTTNAWEDFVFDFSAKTGKYPIVALIADNITPVGPSDIIIYIDDIIVNNDPTPASAAVAVVEDFESIPLNIMLGGADDLSKLEVIPNPDPSGINTSATVVKFMRDKDGVPWGGFWSALPAAVDVTANQYVHVKVWKPRISLIKFKLEGGAAGTSERNSKYPQLGTGVWEDIVIDFKDKTGTYPIIAFLPDFSDPVGLADDIVIYFDDFRITNSPTPEGQVVLNVDMHGVPLVAADTLFIAGDFGGINGSWNQPGTNLNNILTDVDGDSIYSINMNLADGATYPFKFFKNRGWDGGEWTGDPNRKVVVTGSRSFNFMWGVKTYNVTFNLDMHGSGLTAGQPVYVAGDFGGDNGTWNTPGDNPLNELMYTGADSIYTINLVLDTLTYHFKFFKGAGWDGGEWAGDPNRVIVIEGDYTANFLWGKIGQLGVNENLLANKVSAYPVPFSSTLTIYTLVDVKAVVISTSYGQQVARFDNLASGQTTINTSQLASGMYFITFYGKTGGQFTQKLIK